MRPSPQRVILTLITQRDYRFRNRYREYYDDNDYYEYTCNFQFILFFVSDRYRDFYGQFLCEIVGPLAGKIGTIAYACIQVVKNFKTNPNVEVILS